MNLRKSAPYLIFLAAMLWATDAPFRVHLTQSFPSSFIVLMEHLIDVIVVIPIIIGLLPQLKQLGAKQWLAVLVIAVGGSAAASFAFTQAFHYVNPSVAILLQKLQPLIAIGLAASLLREQLNKHFWLWAVLALVGAYIISFPGITPRLFAGESFNPNVIGVSLALVAAILWGASTVMGRYVLEKIDFKLMTGLRFILAFVFLFVWNLGENNLRYFRLITVKDLLFFAIIAVASGVVSLFIYYRGLQFTKASVATLAELGFPLAAVLVNYIFLKDALVPMQLVGMVVLLFAVFQLGRVNAEEPAVVMIDTHSQI
jgi:drug/metabolite transporter (DMT)-like permease